jgi:hypothetical protein
MRTETIIVIFIEREKRNLHIIDGSLSEALAIAILITYQERTIVICKVLGALNQLWGFCCVEVLPKFCPMEAHELMGP